MNEYLDWSASEIARRIAAREVSARDVCAAYIERCRQVHPQLNALIWNRFDDALRDATAIDEKIARGEPVGPLAGVPLTVKECYFWEGSPTTIGLTNRPLNGEPELEAEWRDDRLLPSVALGHAFEAMNRSGDLRGFQPHLADARVRVGAETMRRRTSSQVQKLVNASGILLGKTNVPQFMLWHECDNPVYGRTNNPWDLSRTPGGSTGGEAAILAAHGSALGLGTDMGGSIRVPAAWCGICGLMPTARRLPTTGTFQNFDWLEAITLVPGPMARSVEDLDLAMRALLSTPQGMTERQRVDHEFNVPEVRWRDFREVSPRGLRIGVCHLMCELACSDSVARALREAAEALKAAGATIVEDVFLTSDMRSYLGLITADGGACLREISRGSQIDWRASRIMWLAGMGRISRTMLVAGLRLFRQELLADMVESGGAVSTRGFGDLVRAQRIAQYQALAQFELQHLDAVLLPPHALPAPQHGKPIDLVAGAESAYCANLLGWPAGVVPVSVVRADEETRRPQSRDIVRKQAAAVDQGSTGLPIGVQVMARPWREDIVLAVMSAIDHALPRPKLSAQQLAKIGVKS